MPDVEVVEERHDLRSDPKDRQAFEQYFKEGASNSQFVKRPLVRRTLMLGTLPLLAAPVVLLRDLGPLPGTSLRHTVWSPGRRLLVYGTNTPLTPADFSAPGSAITIVPEGYADDADALTKATVTLIKFRPGELDIPDHDERRHADRHDELDGRQHRRLLQDLHPRGLPGGAVRADHAPPAVPVPPVDLRRGERRRT